MKIFVVLLVVCSAAAYPGIHSNRIEDVPSIADQTAEISKELDETLVGINRILRPVFGPMSAEERLFSVEIVLIITDFERTEEDRRDLLKKLFQKKNISEEEAAPLMHMIDMVFMMTKPIAEKSPLVGKLASSSFAKLILNDEFLFGSLETQKKILLESVFKNIREVKETPKLSEEFGPFECDKDFLAIFQKVLGS